MALSANGGHELDKIEPMNGGHRIIDNQQTASHKTRMKSVYVHRDRTTEDSGTRVFRSKKRGFITPSFTPRNHSMALYGRNNILILEIVYRAMLPAHK